MVLSTGALRASTRLDPDTRGGLRLTLAALAGLLLAVPFTLVLFLVVDGWSPLHRLDVSLDVRLNGYSYRHHGYVGVLKAISNTFSPLSFELASVVVALLLLARKQPRLAAWLTVTVWGGGLLSTLVKQAVGRSRPLVAHPVAHALSASFPSGHSLGVVVGVGALLLVALPSVPGGLRAAAIALGVVIVLAVGFSRLGLGVHYLSDVLAGYVLGAAWLALTTAAFAVWRTERSRGPRPLTDGLEPAAPEVR